MAVKIGHARYGENGITGQAAGDSTKREVCTGTWYSMDSNTSYVLRPKTRALAEAQAQACEAGCANDYIGYDQTNRNTLHTQAKKVGYDLSKITKKCETDCSEFMTICAIAAGVTELEHTGNAPTTRTMRSKFGATGKYEILTDKKYLTSSAYLKRGDITVKPGSHTFMVLSDGSKVSSDTEVPAYKVGQVYTLQVELKVRSGAGTSYRAKKYEELTVAGKKCDADGDGALDAGTRVTCQKIAKVDDDIWIRCPSGWLAAYYNGNTYIK